MYPGQDVLSVIDALPHAVLLLEGRRGKVVLVNRVFLEQSGFKEDLVGRQLISLPFFTKSTRRGLIRLFVKALQGKGSGENFTFLHVRPDATVKEVRASAERSVFSGEEYVIFTFRDVLPQLAAAKEDGMESLRSYLSLGYEPYLEFRSAAPLPPAGEMENRLPLLRSISQSLKVKFANDAAEKLYRGDGSSLEGKTFLSLFNKADDAFRFLDMLSVVGLMKAETTVIAHDGELVQVEMNCAVKFDGEGAISAICCCQRNMSRQKRCEALLGGSRAEMKFMLEQPFVGFAVLAPRRPLEFPKAEYVDEALDAMLSQIVILRANQTMFEIYGTEKTRFLMKPMTELFPDGETARQALKELFVMRTTSLEVFARPGGESQYVSIFRASFDDANRLSGISVAASRHCDGYKARHNNNNNKSNA
ncbi:MAG: PAS domain-containing protein [Synergistaceae bacterium]|nr:PAS domain-containing protein [Synergistaceae bacterium]